MPSYVKTRIYSGAWIAGHVLAHACLNKLTPLNGERTLNALTLLRKGFSLSWLDSDPEPTWCFYGRRVMYWVIGLGLFGLCFWTFLDDPDRKIPWKSIEMFGIWAFLGLIWLLTRRQNLHKTRMRWRALTGKQKAALN